MSEQKQKELEIYIKKLEELIQSASVRGHKTAPETHERLCKIENCLFGNKDLGEIGIHEMVTDMYQFFKGADFSRKLLLWVFLALGTISGGIIGTVEVLKRLK